MINDPAYLAHDKYPWSKREEWEESVDDGDDGVDEADGTALNENLNKKMME